MYTRLEVLRIENSRLYQLSKQFNERLEEKVRERTQELQEAYGRLKRLDKTKADFITIASHELRTPLTILNTHNQILLQDKDIQANEAQLKQLQGIHKGAARMEEIMEAMLDVAKIDSQSLSLNLAPVKLAIFIRIVSQQFQQALVDRSLTLQIEDLGQLPAIEADAEALRKVFHHLIANAIKYTPDGGRILVQGYNHDSEVEITIADSGIGIAPHMQPLIFEKFFQTGEVKLHSSGKTTFKGGGSGLGLAIVKGIVEAHNGRIWVESQGHDEQTLPGSTFHLLLPVEQ
jgi:signal transduction histidine kinase